MYAAEREDNSRSVYYLIHAAEEEQQRRTTSGISEMPDDRRAFTRSGA